MEKDGKTKMIKMDYRFWLPVACFLLLAGHANSSPFISYDALQVHEGIGRSLLQTLKPCNVSFQDMDYSVLTNNCKGPTYPAKGCCNAFKEFICPVVDSFNDETSDCATTAFSYINLYGKYPPGLFANECVEGKEGLDCNTVTQSKDQKSSAPVGAAASFPFVVFVVAASLIVVSFRSLY